MNENDLIYKFANEFKKRDNVIPMGAMIGKIIEPLPNIKIQLLNIPEPIEKEKIYLSNAITNRLAIECTMKDFESAVNTFSGGQTTDGTNLINGITSSGSGATETGGRVLQLSGQNGSFESMAIENFQNQLENKSKGKFILQTVFHLKKGMLVLVIPNEAEDQYFVVDVFPPASEVSLNWEYYQK